MTGILASSLVERMAAADPTAPLLAPVLITLGLATIVTGIVLCGFGVTRMGRAIRYVPYPVVGGFLGATGCLILLGAIRVITGHRLQFATLDQFANMLTLSELAAACAMALVLYLTWHRSRSSFGLPAILIGGVIAAHIAFWLAGISLAEAQASGWTFQPPPNVNFMLPWSANEISRYPWYALPDLIGNLIAVVFVTATSTLFNTTGIEVASQREADLERELNVTGLANMLSGAFGGYTGCISVSRSVLNFNSGGTGRLSGLTVAAISALMLAAAPALLGYMPKFVLGGLLIYLGADQLHKWIVQSRRRLASRISVAAGDHRHHRAMGFHRRHPDRRRDRLRDIRAERVAHRFHQIQLRRLGIPQLAGPLARRSGGAIGAWRQNPGPQPAKLSVLRFGQPALPARQGAARAASGMPLSGVRLQARHRHRFIGGLQFRPDQARRPRPRHQAGAGPSAIRGRERRCDRANSSRTRSASCPNWITRWSGARTRSSRSIRASNGKKPRCATGSPRFSGPSTTPRN